ncbi:MAG: SUMF1/EgtB/PvdO family nonheme iron enzyme [Ktedonobacteraceae bacterium]|nr:SUMF1/EgtB/PvdO family nonheme iron enzyme [Ktedonobacteraceae bacterium]
MLGRFQRLSPNVALLPSIFTKTALNRLQQALEDESRPDQQITAARALGGMGDIVLDLTPLMDLLHKGIDSKARVAAAHALAVLESGDQEHPGHEELRIGLLGNDIILTRIIAEALVEAGGVAFQLIVLAANVASNDDETRRIGTLALGGVGPRAKDELTLLLNDPNPIVASTAVEMLNFQGESSESLMPVLLRMAREGAESAIIDRVLKTLLPYSLRELGFQGRLLKGVIVIIPPLVTILAESGSASETQRLANGGVFQIAKYPLTVAEYACAVRDKAVVEPIDWEYQLKRLEHPVAQISKGDAEEYAIWLGRLTDQPWRLPTVTEWEKAASGTKRTVYPWGNFWDPEKANTFESHLNTTTPVGSYPSGASSYGCQDMAGNVEEWCDSSHPAGALRGGSYLLGENFAQTTNPGPDTSDTISIRGIGARLVNSLSPERSSSQRSGATLRRSALKKRPRIQN